MSNLQELLQQRDQVSRDWNEARAREVELQKTLTSPTEQREAKEAEAAEIDEQIRQAQLTQDVGYNNHLIAQHNQLWARLRPILDDPTRALTEEGYTLAAQVGRSFEAQQSHAEGSVSRFHAAYPNRAKELNDQDYYVSRQAERELRSDFLTARARFTNSLPLWAFLSAWISEATEPKLRQYRQAVTFAFRGEVYNPGPDFNAQAATDNHIKSYQRGR